MIATITQSLGSTFFFNMIVEMVDLSFFLLPSETFWYPRVSVGVGILISWKMIPNCQEAIYLKVLANSTLLFPFNINLH